jgi:hypothetical protein
MRAVDGFSWSNVAAGTYPAGAASNPGFLQGGYYQTAAIATWSTGNLQLQQLAADGSTWINVGAPITANGVQYNYLPPGRYQVVITTATASYGSLTRVPLD